MLTFEANNRNALLGKLTDGVFTYAKHLTGDTRLNSTQALQRMLELNDDLNFVVISTPEYLSQHYVRAQKAGMTMVNYNNGAWLPSLELPPTGIHFAIFAKDTHMDLYTRLSQYYSLADKKLYDVNTPTELKSATLNEQFRVVEI